VIRSKVLFSKLQLATYIYNIHYIYPFEFILGYIVHRLVIIIIVIIIIIIIISYCMVQNFDGGKY